MSATKTRVYVAFDFGDRKLAAMMGGQLRNPNSGYEVALLATYCDTRSISRRPRAHPDSI